MLGHRRRLDGRYVGTRSSLRVLYVIDSLGMGGAERTLATIVDSIAAESIEPRVCVLQDREGNPVADAIMARGVPVDMVPVRRLRDLSAPLRLRRYVRSHGIQVMHCHLEFAVSMGAPVGRSLGIPVVATSHTFGPTTVGTRESMHQTLYRWSLRNANSAVIALSGEGRRYLVDVVSLPARKVRVIYNGVETDRFRPRDAAERSELRSRLRIGDESPLIATVSVLRREKGIADLIEAMPQICDRSDATLLVVGDGDDRSRLERLAASLGLNGEVRFLGQRDDIPAILGASDLFVLPTLGDMLPTVIAEAMAAGLPVVATDVGSVPEMVKDGVTGLLAPPGSADELADRCIELLTDRDRAAALGAGGRRRAEELFDVRRQAGALASLYRDLVEVTA